MTNNLTYNVISLTIIIIIILHLMNRDRKCRENFNNEDQDTSIAIRVLGDASEYFEDGIIDIERIISTDINI